MPLRWITKPKPAQSPLTPKAAAAEPPITVLAAPGSVSPRQRLTQVLAAGSLLAVAARPWPGPLPHPAAVTFNVTNLNPVGAGSLRQAILSANHNPGPDVINIDPGLAGTIALTATLPVTDSVQIHGPGPGQLSVSGSNAFRVFYLYSPGSVPFTATISGLTLRDGKTSGSGGGILNKAANLTLDAVDLISNTAGVGGDGGGLEFGTSSLVTASLTIRNSLISGNHARKGGGLHLFTAYGGVVIQNSQIVSNTTDGSGAGIYFYRPSDALIEDSSILSNTAGSNGGGLFLYLQTETTTLTIRRTTIAGNHALSSGGGVFVYAPRNLLIEDATIAGNVTGPAGHGGGLNVNGTGVGSNIIRRTTLSGNTAGNGGGVYLYAINQPLVIEDSTISGNHATAGSGGGIYLYNPSAVTVRNSTIVSNTATSGAGGVSVLISALPVTNTIIAGNTVLGVGRDITGTFVLHYDLVQITGTAHITDTGGNLFGLDPLLGPLADNGGPTQTKLPAHNSPAVNAGDPAFAPPPSTDQRGRPRAQGRIDIGAVEVSNDLFLPVVKR